MGPFAWLANQERVRVELKQRLTEASGASETLVEFCINVVRLGFWVPTCVLRTDVFLEDLVPAGLLWRRTPSRQLGSALVAMLQEAAARGNAPWRSWTLEEMADAFQAAPGFDRAPTSWVQLDHPWYQYHGLAGNIDRLCTLGHRAEARVCELVDRHWRPLRDRSKLIEITFQALERHTRIPHGFFRPWDYIRGKTMGDLRETMERVCRSRYDGALRTAEHDEWKSPDTEPPIPPGSDPHHDLLIRGHTRADHRRDPYGTDLTYTVHYVLCHMVQHVIYHP